MSSVTITEPMNETRSIPPAAVRSSTPDRRVDLRTLVGSGDRITLLTLPFAVVGTALNVRYPSRFAVGGRRRGSAQPPLPC